MDDEMRNFYATNEDFRKYVRGYKTKHKLSLEEAFERIDVKNYYEYKKDADKGKISVTDIKAGCGAASGGDCK